ncbi:MAG TPA: hypothetical protein PLN52_00290 [Opitutaceae bacterium]|nr:hypothetical protein [Opitutaceae bacterium]
MPVHLAITRRVRPGCEAAFERAVRDFFRDSFGNGVQGAHLLSPVPGSGSREYGVLRTFASEAERAAFYRSPIFRAWEDKVLTLTEGPAQQRQLHGLEAWFHSGGPPPRWKMAVITYIGVYGITLLLTQTLTPLLKDWPLLLANGVFNLVVVGLLTWVVMPLLTLFSRPWLHASST